MTSDAPILAADLCAAAEALARNPHEPLSHRLAARALLSAQSAEKQREALAAFEAFTAELEGELAKLLHQSNAAASGPADDDPIEANDVREPEDHQKQILPINRSGKFEEIAEQYLAIFERMQPLRAEAARIAAVRRRVLSGQDSYLQVERATGVPWFFTAIVHGLEGGFDFSRHLHNGDPLSGRTVKTPKGRPAMGEPPFTWTTSAEDALRGHALEKVEVWSLQRILFEWERFNGFGYRYRGLPTPYLWSGSDQYSTGKYVRDGVFDADAVSRQIGAAVIMQAMITEGDIAAPLRRSGE